MGILAPVSSILSPVARLLADLIALPSVNPAFLPPGDPRVGEHRMCDYLTARAAAGGLDVEIQEVAPGRSNLIASLSPRGTVRSRILLAPHLDTVGLPSLDELLQPRISGGRIYGRGACDTKGCVAVMFQALLDLAQSSHRPESTEICFVGFVDEENAQAGSRHYARHGRRADLAVVGEPTRLEVVTAHKGDVWLELITRGRSAHGSTPHLGRNAVLLAARAVEVLETEYADQLKKRKHPLLGHATINVGSCHGGTQPNIVPAECRIALDRRTLPGETETGVRREIIACLRRHRIPASFDSLRTAPCPSLETDPNLPLVRALMKAAKRKTPRGVNYFCDAAPLAEGGIPSVVFGPGDIAQAHTSDEWIQIRQLDQGLGILKRFLDGLS